MAPGRGPSTSQPARATAGHSAATMRSSRRLGTARRDRQRLGADEALEASDERPDRAKPQGGAVVDGLDAGLADEARAAVAGVLDPVAEEHTDGARLVPGGEVVGAGETWVVARERPDPPGEPGQQVVLAVVEDGERIAPEDLGERRVARRARQAPADDAAEQARVGEADLLRRAPQRIRRCSRRARVMRAHGGTVEPAVEDIVHRRLTDARGPSLASRGCDATQSSPCAAPR